MFTEMMMSAGGGTPITINDLTFDGKTQIGSITSRGGTWTATKDCVMAATVRSTSDYGAAQIFFDDLCVLLCYNGTNEQYARIGYSDPSSTVSPNGVGMFVPKGTVVKTRSDTGTYTIYFYA